MSKKKNINGTYIIICSILIILPIIYYFCYALPKHNKALQEIELQKLEYQKEQARKEEEQKEQEKIMQENERMEKIDKDTDGYVSCKNAAESKLNMMLDAKVGCDRNVPGAIGECVFYVNSRNADTVKQITDDFEKAIDKCKKDYPDADFDLINYQENPYPHPEG